MHLCQEIANGVKSSKYQVSIFIYHTPYIKNTSKLVVNINNTSKSVISNSVHQTHKSNKYIIYKNTNIPIPHSIGHIFSIYFSFSDDIEYYAPCS